MLYFMGYVWITQRGVPWRIGGILACLTDKMSDCCQRWQWEGGGTLCALVVLEKLHSLKRSGTADELMGELCLVVVPSTILVDLLVGILRFP